MCPYDRSLSVFERMSEDELELYNLMTAKFTNKGAREMVWEIEGAEECRTRESWQAYKEAFKKLVDESKTWRMFKKGFPSVRRIFESNGLTL